MSVALFTCQGHTKWLSVKELLTWWEGMPLSSLNWASVLDFIGGPVTSPAWGPSTFTSLLPVGRTDYWTHGQEWTVFLVHGNRQLRILWPDYTVNGASCLPKAVSRIMGDRGTHETRNVRSQSRIAAKLSCVCRSGSR